MRLDARKGDTGYDIWDVARCCRVERVLWVDTDSATWAGYRRADEGRPESHETVMRWIAGDAPIHQERRITVYPLRKLILFNELDDPPEESTPATVTTPVLEGVPAKC